MNKFGVYYNQYSPALVPLSDNETDEQFDQRWAKFDALPEDVKDKLLSLEVAEMVFAISEAFHLPPQKAAYISRAIRGFYCRELPLENWKDYLVRNMGVSQDVAWQITQKVERDILRTSLVAMQAKSNNLKKLNFQEALRQYPNIGEQLISTNQLKLRIMPTPVRPSIKNWITDFHEQMGLGKHSTLDRGNYIFHSENAKRLTSEERRRLSMIFKSLEEGDELIIDPDKQEIKFENTQESDQPMESSSQAATSWKTEPYQPSPMNDGTRPEQTRAALSNQQQNNYSNPTPFTIKKQTQSTEQIRPMSREEGIFPMRSAQGQVTNTNQQSVRHDIPQNLPTANDEKVKSYFDRNPNKQDFVVSNQFQEKSGKEFENKSPNFSQLLKSQQNDEPVRQQPSNNASTNSSGGTVSFSSPQQLPVERKAAIPGRSPYRISPHDED